MKMFRNRKAVTTTEGIIIVVLILAVILSASTLFYVSTVTSQLAGLSTSISKLSDSLSKLSSDLATVSKTVEEVRKIVGAPPPTPTPTPPPPPKYKDTLIVGTTDSVELTIDPAQAYDWFGWHILQQTGDVLVHVRPGSKGGPEDYDPHLATDWSVSADLMTWTFNLRKGVKFEDGREFTAEDVKYSIDRAIALIPSIPEGAPAGLGYDAVIDSVEVSGTYQVKFHLKIPFAPFLGFLHARSSSIVDRKYAPMMQINYTEGDARASTPVGFLGPYKLTRWVRIAGKDNEMRLEANPNYWNAVGGYPKTKRIIYKFYADATALRLAIEAGDIDIAFRHITAADVLDLTKKPDLKVWWGTGAFIQYMIFQEKIKPFDDARVRRALAAALNRPEVCRTVFLGTSEPLYSIIPKGMMGHTETFKELGDANYALTKSLLAELGYNENNKLPVELWYESSGHYPMSADQALMYKDSFEKSGVITVTIKAADWPSYKKNRDAEIMPVYVYGWYPDYVDPDNYAFLYWAKWLHHNYENPEIVALYDKARATTDLAERTRLYAEIDKIAVWDSPVIPLFQGVAWAVTKPDVEGLVLDITQDMRYWLVYAEIPA